MKPFMLAVVGTVTMAMAMPAFAATAKSSMTSDHTADKKFEKYDANRDGVISSSEMNAAKDYKFSEMDANRDGMVSKAEVRAWQEENHTM